MSNAEVFKEEILKGYTPKGGSLLIGAGMLNGEIVPEAKIQIPLATLNRHGLIAGATGTGKTKTLQGLAEGLSAHGVNVMMMDIKGDLSGIAAPGTVNDKISSRHEKLGIPWKAQSFPCELMSLSGEKGVRLRATVSEFGPVLFSKILGLNDTQSGVVSLVFKYADDKSLALLDLKDFKKVLQYCTNEGKEEIKKEYGAISTASASTILRKIIEIEEQGAELFFGELSFDTEDLLRISDDGKGFIHIVRLTDIQDKPKLFSTFMLCLLAEIYQHFPEEGDMEQPKLVLFIDEAHLIFKEASKALLDQLESIIKLIRSKGVGIIFCTQTPVDIPAAILGQLGLKIQHALRAFTANDRKAIKMVSENYPESDFYKVDTLITELGIGEALVTALTEKGTPSPLVHTCLCAPGSRMDVLTESEQDAIISNSPLFKKYSQQVDRESAYEILNGKLDAAGKQEAGEAEPTASSKKAEKEEGSVIGDALDSTVGRQVARTIAREVTRGLLGVLGLGGSSRSRKKSWF
ncbi:MAG: helicase HerA-like domain-containing protein [Bacteroidia bacterium]